MFVISCRECEVQQSFVFSSATSLSWRSSCACETSMDSSKTSYCMSADGGEEEGGIAGCP